MTAIHVRNLTKSFDGSRLALDRVSLDIAPGEMVALIGASGSGKSTLLRNLAGLVAADRDGDTGLVQVGDEVVQRGGRLSRDVRRLRSRTGFVFQQFNLVGRLPVIVNVLTGRLHAMPVWRSLLRRFTPVEMQTAAEALERVGIADQAWKRASALSGGQHQRAAIARALVQGARTLLADEPIASLDPESARRVMDILADINRRERCTVVVSLHQIEVALKYCPRIVALRSGRVVYDGPAGALTAERLQQIYGSDYAELVGVPASAAPAPVLLPAPAFMDGALAVAR